jgi:hypothetical protein
MPLLIAFPARQERLRAIDILAEAGETYHGVPTNCYVISEAAAKLLRSQEVHFQIVGEKDKETIHAAGS